MIGGMIENLKNPKNVLTTLLFGLGATFLGYLWMVHFGRWEALGNIVGFLGLLVILFTVFRLGLTKPLLGIVLVVALAAYFMWYQKSCAATSDTLSWLQEEAPWRIEERKVVRPKYSDSGIAQYLNEAVFAPAYVFDSTILNRGRWRTNTAIKHSGWTPPKR